MKNFILAILLMATTVSNAQNNKPKLVVGIVVDQMRYDYLDRYWNKFGEDGFKKLINNGFNCQNTHYNYMPTYTAPGHASIYSGTTPENHGIIANTWFNKESGKYFYCTEDTTVATLGSGSKNGLMSPKNMITTTITDELKLATNFKGKVIGVSLKDRGAILPAGHKADAAYWYDGGNEGKWISSTYYMNDLPKWVQDVNSKNSANTYLNKPWNTLLPIKDYTESIPDDNHYEGTFTGEEKPIFPHNLPALRDSNSNYSLIKATPFGNTILKEMAIAAIKGEQLGKDDITDFLAISFSSPDYVGHQFGPMSIEVEDTYLRLDRELAEILTLLEAQFKNDEVLIFLTADHGAVNVPQYLIDNHIPAGYFDMKSAAKDLSKKCKTQFGVDSLIRNISNSHVFLDYNRIDANKLNQKKIENAIATWLLDYEGVALTLTRNSLESTKFDEGIASIIQRGFNQNRSGDILFTLESGWIMSGYSTGTTHGSPYQYDTHVPLLWYGAGIAKGETKSKIVIPDIAATLAVMLNIQAPSACTGLPIKELVK
ncbi:alkaline phosphatase family protein [Vicingus serpentipes]|uniref:glycerophosphocholine cholinephosphodiesterase n=1 Tax=Vicingus serpentipes TaxID=1926625 RepID=A0A5C6RS07_9FLAO|nr:alkaline phosphatase PafA [Vicingus serpentipes]TXB64809.1 alkaline phosphatase family protein [Vicingus serpentipes]